MSKTATIAEIVTFRLMPEVDPDAFVQAAQALEPFLRQTGHVTGRCLSVDGEGNWTDHVLWTSLDVARSTAERLMAEAVAAPMLQMIDPATVQMRHATIRYQQE